MAHHVESDDNTPFYSEMYGSSHPKTLAEKERVHKQRAEDEYKAKMRGIAKDFERLKPGEAGSDADAAPTDNGRGHKNLAHKESKRG